MLGKSSSESSDALGEGGRAPSLTIFGSTLPQLLDAENRLGADLPVWIDFACKALTYKGTVLGAGSRSEFEIFGFDPLAKCSVSLCETVRPRLI